MLEKTIKSLKDQGKRLKKYEETGALPVDPTFELTLKITPRTGDLSTFPIVNSATPEIRKKSESGRYQSLKIEDPIEDLSFMVNKQTGKKVKDPQGSPNQQEVYDQKRFDLLKKLMGEIVNRKSLWKK